MNLCDDIFKFISDNGIDASEEESHAIRILHCPDDVIVVPVSIHSKTLEEAEEANHTLKGLLSALNTKKSIIIPEDLWRRRRNMMECRLLAHLGRFRSVFARNTEVHRITKPMSSEFLDRHHTYGDAAARYRYGIFTKSGEMVAVGSFSSGRTWEKGGTAIRSFEWVRYASLPDVRVVGGMGKMLSTFISEVHPDDIMSYADMEWTDGQVYEKLGFREDGRFAPIPFAINADSWERTALSRAGEPAGNIYYHFNLGSRKFRLNPGLNRTDIGSTGDSQHSTGDDLTAAWFNKADSQINP